MKSDMALSKLNLYKELGDNRFEALNFGVYKETLRLYVKETDGKRSKNLINMPIMFINARLLSEKLEELNNKEAPYNTSLDFYGAKWDNKTNKRIPNERDLMGKVGLARVANKDGDIINLMFVVTKDGIRKTFPLIPTPYLDIYENGKKLDDKERLSKMWTRAYAKSFDQVLAALPEVNNERHDDDDKGGYKKKYDKPKETTTNDSISDLDDI